MTIPATPSYIDPRFPAADPYAPLGTHPLIEVNSQDFASGEQIPLRHTAQGEDLSPHLAIGELPEGTKSLAITCFDPDAPTGSGFWHWAVCNLPVDLKELPTGADLAQLAENALVLRGDSGVRGYYGPNPPAGHGPHRYLYVVHAVDVPELAVPADATCTVLGFNLYFHTLGRGLLWGWFETPAS